jgi:hypothetical protein
MSQQNDENSSNEEGDFVMLEQQLAAVDVSEQQKNQTQAREVVNVNWPNSNGPTENGNDLNELKLKMAALEVQ